MKAGLPTVTLAGGETISSSQSEAEEEEETAGAGAVSSVGVRSMSGCTRGGTGHV